MRARPWETKRILSVARYSPGQTFSWIIYNDREIFRTGNVRGSVAAVALLQLSRNEISRSTYRVGPKISKGNFSDNLGYDSFATNGTRYGFLKEQAKIKHACINRECQSSLRRGGRTDLYLLAFDIRGPCAMQFLSMGFMRKYLGVIWKLLSLISTGSNAIVSPRNSNWPSRHWRRNNISMLSISFLVMKTHSIIIALFRMKLMLIVTISILLL